MIVAGLAWHLPVHEPARRLEIEHENLRRQQRGLHPLALARPLALQQRQQNALGRENAGGEIGNRNAGAHRALARQAGHRHDAAHALRDLVEPRPLAIRAVLAEAGNAGVDQARIDRAQRLVIDAEPVLDVGPVIFDQHVGLAHQALQNLDALFAFEVERHRALVAVQILKVGGIARLPPDSASSPVASTLMTSAPQSASCRTQVGPDRTRVRSTTL